MNEIRFAWQTGRTLDRYITSSNQRFNGTTFETFSASNWSTYAAAVSEQGASGDYFANFPTAITTAGTYRIVIRERAGVSPAITDRAVGEGYIDWDGSQEITVLDVDATLGNAPISVSITSPVASNGQIVIVQGDDYLVADGRALEFSISNAVDLTGATVTFTANKISSNDNEGDETLTKSMTIVTATGATKVLRMELTTLNTSTLAVGAHGYGYDIQAVLSNASIVTLQLGTMTVRGDHT